MDYQVLTFYKFLEIKDIEALREKLRTPLVALSAKGTILIAPEGVNGSISVRMLDAENCAALLQEHLGELTFKENPCESQPFRRLLLRKKKEIITFKQNGIDPIGKPSPYLSPKEFRQWYRDGKDMVVIDTRNAFEVEFGTFKDAIHYNINNFTEFADVVQQLPEEMKDKTIVTFCTGGIRCEKAAPFMENLGFKDVHQLDGGILNYFKECGGESYEGECFVFDHRCAVDENLHETNTSYCVHCQTPLTDSRLKTSFSIRERYCETCYEFIPNHLSSRWTDYLKDSPELAKKVSSSYSGSSTNNEKGRSSNKDKGRSSNDNDHCTNNNDRLSSSNHSITG